LKQRGYAGAVVGRRDRRCFNQPSLALVHAMSTRMSLNRGANILHPPQRDPARRERRVNRLRDGFSEAPDYRGVICKLVGRRGKSLRGALPRSRGQPGAVAPGGRPARRRPARRAPAATMPRIGRPGAVIAAAVEVPSAADVPSATVGVVDVGARSSTRGAAAFTVPAGIRNAAAVSASTLPASRALLTTPTPPDDSRFGRTPSPGDRVPAYAPGDRGSCEPASWNAP
jgi:hypothetical protein